jgi:hypothetical protein
MIVMHGSSASVLCLPGGTRLSPQPARASESQGLRVLLEWLHGARRRRYLLMKAAGRAWGWKMVVVRTDKAHKG